MPIFDTVPFIIMSIADNECIAIHDSDNVKEIAFKKPLTILYSKNIVTHYIRSHNNNLNAFKGR